MTLARRQVIVGSSAAGLNAIKASGEDGLEELSFSDPERKNNRMILFACKRILGTVLLDIREDMGCRDA
jgi:hypothetical protein